MVNTTFLRLYFSDLTDKISTVNARFQRSIPTFPHRKPVVAVTVRGHILASPVCSIFPKSVSNLTIIESLQLAESQQQMSRVTT